MSPSSVKSFMKKLVGINRLFLVTVVIPTACALLYWGMTASDIYQSESHFVVRSAKSQSMSSSGIGSALQGLGLSTTGADPYTVQDFVASRDALRQLEDKLHVSKIYADKRVDFVNRFGGVMSMWETDFEALWRYFYFLISVDIDSSSNIATMTVDAFSAEDAYRINEFLLEAGEQLVNRMNDNIQKDSLKFALSQSAKSGAKSKEAQLAVARYRIGKGLYDPEIQATQGLSMIAKLQGELITAKIQLAQILSVSKDNPQIGALNVLVKTLQTEIDAETNKVAGKNRPSLSGHAAEYEHLLVERDYAAKEFEAALAFLEQTRIQIQQQQLYLIRIVEPNKPLTPVPRRLRNIIASILISLIIWGISTLMIAGIREHTEK